MVLLIGSRMPEIQVASMHCGWDERRADSALSPKTVLDNYKKKN